MQMREQRLLKVQVDVFACMHGGCVTEGPINAS